MNWVGGTWKVHVHFGLVFPENSLLILENDLENEAKLIFKKSIVYLFWCLMHIPSTDLENFIFDIFENWIRRFKFAVVFRVNECGYQNIFPALIFANCPR